MANANAAFAPVDLLTAELELNSSIYEGFSAAIMVKGQPRTVALCREYGDAVQLMAVIENAKTAVAPPPTPRWEGQFDNFQQWVNRASTWLTGRQGSTGESLGAICIDAKGRRCNIGKDFMRARDEDAFPVRFFWDCEPEADA